MKVLKSQLTSMQKPLMIYRMADFLNTFPVPITVSTMFLYFLLLFVKVDINLIKKAKDRM